jgi:hypothetical protein
MKPQIMKLALVSTFVLASPLLTFAGGQPAKMRPYSKEEMQDPTGITRAVQQGKGSGMTRSEVQIRANAYRSQTAEGSAATVQQSTAAHSNWNDSAFHK